MSDFYDEMQGRDAFLPGPDEGYYGPGGETTAEERFLYSQEMSEFLDEWEVKIISPPDRYGKWYRHGARSFLEHFAWALRQKIEAEGL